jgi:hypothetical protein
MLETTQKSKTAFLASLQSLGATPISHEQMALALKSVPETDFTAAEWNNVVEFALRQLALWRVQWLFSSAQAPDTAAKAEDDAWERLWGAFYSALADKVLEVAHPLHRKKGLVIAQALLQRKLQLDGDSTLRKWSASAGGGLAIALNRLGCRRIAGDIYKRTLYPPGTVGRTLA